MRYFNELTYDQKKKLLTISDDAKYALFYDWTGATTGIAVIL